MTKKSFKREAVIKQTTTYSRGEMFVGIDGVQILSQIGDGSVCLVNLYDGNRYNDPVKVVDVYHITEQEFDEICGGDSGDIRMLESVEINYKEQA